jgi:AcrR family transcriptional regulator
MTSPNDDRRAAIDRAARAIFERRGYASVTVKSIGVAAGVGPSVLSSFYRNKAELFAAVMDLPFDPTSAIPRLVAPGLDGLGERLVRLALQAAQDEQLRDDVGAVGPLIPGAVTNTPGSVRAVWEYVTGEVVDQVLLRAGIPDAKMRGALITSFLGGIVIARYGVAVEPLASASEDEVVALVGPTIQRLLDPTQPLLAPVAQ